MEPKVSIILLVYMVEKYVGKSIESIINQTYKSIEIILSVSDGSDKSLEICKEYAQKDNRILIVEREAMGVGQARNFAMEVASGKYILIVDGDDWMEPTMVERLVGSIVKNESDVAICGDVYEYENDPNLRQEHIANLPEVFGREEFYREVLSHNTFGLEVWNKLYEFSKVKDIPFLSVEAEDKFWNADVFERLDKISYVPSAEYHFVVRGNSGSRKPHVMESAMKADILLCENIEKHGYLQEEAAYFLFISCYVALYEAIHFRYFDYHAWSETYKRMRGLSPVVRSFEGARKQDKVKAMVVGIGFHPLIWFMKLSMRIKPAGLYNDSRGGE